MPIWNVERTQFVPEIQIHAGKLCIDSRPIIEATKSIHSKLRKYFSFDHLNKEATLGVGIRSRYESQNRKHAGLNFPVFCCTIAQFHAHLYRTNYELISSGCREEIKGNKRKERKVV